VTDEQLIEELERSHKFRTYGGQGYTLHGEAAQRLRELKLYIEQLKETKHWLNEQLLEVRTDLQLAEVRLRERG
jgi:hypothetical protein